MKKLSFFSWDNLFATLVVFGVLQFLPILFTIDFLDPIQNTIEDFNAADVVFSKLRDYEEIEADTNIVLINLSYLDRAGIGALINIINEYSPKVIGIDSFFRLPKEAEVDSVLALALRNTENLVLVSKADYASMESESFDTVRYSHHMFNKYAKTGFANIITDDKSGFRVVRSFSPKEMIQDSLRLFFALEMAKYIDSDKVKRFIERDNAFEYINYKRNIYNREYKVFDVNDVFNRSEELSKIKNKVVLLGFLGPDINTLVFEDIFFTPKNPNYMGKAYPDMYGMVIHANVISMVIEEDFVSGIPFWLVVIITFIFVYCNMALFHYIERKFENVYETANLLITTVELGILFTIMILTFYLFQLDLGFKEATLFGLIFSATGFELYHGSFKPIVQNIYKRFSRKSLRDASDKLFDDYEKKEENKK